MMLFIIGLLFVPISPALGQHTTNYTLQTSDCGNAVTLGGNAFFTLTVGPASEFPAGCSVIVANVDSLRGKLMSIDGMAFPNWDHLWPLQTFSLLNANNAWVILNPPTKWKLRQSTTFYVDPDGSILNDGLAAGSSGAFPTIQSAINIVAEMIDANQQPLIIQTKCNGGPPLTYNENVQLMDITGALQTGGLDSPTPLHNGDPATPRNCIINGNSMFTLFAVGKLNDWIVRGFKYTNASTSCVVADGDARIRLGEADFAVCGGATGAQIIAENNGTVEAMANYSVSAGAAYHVLANNRGLYQTHGQLAVTVENNPAFIAFVFANRNSLQLWLGSSISGSATGQRYDCSLGGGIDTGGSGVNFFPGDSAGICTSPGWYN
jgi:hypothetical protein